MAPPPMGRLNGSFVNGGRKDEPDLPDWNTGFSYYKDGCLDLLEHLRTDKNTEENCHALHELLFEETLYGQKIGKPFVDVLNERGVLPGIKVDKGTIEVVGTHKKTTTHGHDDLGKHCAKYYEAGAQFAKWRAVLKIGPNEPSEEVVLQISGINRSAATNKIGNLVSKYIFMMSTGDDGGFGSEGNSATHTNGGNHQSGTDLATDHKPIVILDTGAEVNVTGHEAMFVPVSFQPEGFGLRAANGNEIKSYMCGYLLHEMYHMNYVYFSEDVGPRTIISGPELDMLGYSLKFEGGTCEVRDKGFLVGKGCLVEKKRYLMEFLKIPLNRVPVQVPNVQENVPVPDGPVGRPLSVLIPVWTAIREVLRRFSGSLFKPEEAPRRPPV